MAHIQANAGACTKQTSDHFAEIRRADKQKRNDGAGYTEEFIYGTKSFQNFLTRIGTTRLSKLRKNMQNVLK